MKVVLDGSPPSWVAQCTDDALRARLGSGVHSRGEAYAQGRAVHTLSLLDDGRLLQAQVRGSGPNNYLTEITTKPSRPAAPTSPAAPVSWSGRCSCPMQLDCKHVAAVLITTRQLLSATSDVPRMSSWETQLADALRVDPPRNVTLAVLGF